MQSQHLVSMYGFIPMLRDDGVLEELFLGGPILALLRYRKLVLLLLEFAAHVLVRRIQRKTGDNGVW